MNNPIPIFRFFLYASFIFNILPIKARCQQPLKEYAAANMCTLNIKDTSSNCLSGILQKKINDSRIIMLGEGGSHYLEFYTPLELYFITMLNSKHAVTTIVMECGSSVAFLCNKFLQTGDSSYLPKFSSSSAVSFWNTLYRYNQGKSMGQRIKVAGIDFESPRSYFKALRLLLTDNTVPESIAREIALIRNSSDSISCDALVKSDQLFKHSLKANEIAWKQYFGDNFPEVKLIVSNKGSCKDAYRNRNHNMQQRFELLHASLKEELYFCVLGQAHTNLKAKNAARLLNTDKQGPFAGKVTVINTYCHNCTTSKEPVYNWTLKGGEQDIKASLLALCKEDFTLFDFSDVQNPVIKNLTSYGQFLLVAQGQH